MFNIFYLINTIYTYMSKKDLPEYIKTHKQTDRHTHTHTYMYMKRKKYIYIYIYIYIYTHIYIYIYILIPTFIFYFIFLFSDSSYYFFNLPYFIFWIRTETPHSLLCDRREAYKESSDETESIAIIFSAETHSWEDKGVHTFPKGYLPESGCNSATGVRTCLLRFRTPLL